jgi:hypothetical protein
MRLVLLPTTRLPPGLCKCLSDRLEVVYDHPKSNYGGRVVVPQKTGNAVPRSGRMKDFREMRRPANLVVLKSGERSSASLGGRAKDC